MTYDVAVVGAGSNGATAAHFLAKRGFKTVLLEMSKEPGEKCHGATEYAPVPFHGKSRPELAILMKKVIRKIPHLNPGDLGKGGFHYYVNSENRVVYKFYTEAPGDGWKETYGVNNPDFIRGLVKEAVKAGVELRTGNSVVDVILKSGKVNGVVTDRGEKIRARLTIAADGRISTVAKKVGLLKKWEINRCWYQYGETWKFRSEEEMFEYVDYGRHIFFGSTLTPPYHWQACTLTLRPGGIVTVNTPTSWTPVSDILKARKKPRSVYMKNLYRLMEVKRMLRPCKGFPDEPVQRQSTFMPGPPLKKPYMGGLIICGDAGGLGGICGAGYLAADYVTPLLKEGNLSERALSGYKKARLLRGVELPSEHDELSPTMTYFWTRGAGFGEQHNCSVDEMVENMRIGASPFILGAPNPEKVGEFGYVDLGAWIIATKINYIMTLYGRFLKNPKMFARILAWVQKNQESFEKNKVFDHPF